MEPDLSWRWVQVNEGVRIDKWLWAVRLFKTRSLATEFCKKGRITMANMPVKASRMIQIGDRIDINKPPVTYSYEVTGLISNRVSAKIAVEQYKDLTPEEELNRLKNIQESAFFVRDRGAGRPTKKERRDLEKFGL